MAHKSNIATLVREPGRNYFSIKFRHPRRFTADGKPGLAVRRGLGTDDQGEADRLVTHMNQLLADDSFWVPGARDKASKLFDPRIVEAFYANLGAMVANLAQERDRRLPLPGRREGYRRVLMLGTFGAGKTTLVRQILGTNPNTERFPATSANRTTTAKLEVIVVEGSYRAIVTFVPRDEVKQYIDECVVEAALADVADGSRDEVARRLLEHRDQRFRLSHILGSLPTTSSKFVKAFQGDEGITNRSVYKGTALSEPDLVTEDERKAMRETIAGYIDRIQSMTKKWRAQESPRLANLDSEEIKQRCEEELPAFAEFASLTDDIFDEISRRINDLPVGQMERGKDRWPTLWQFTSDDRAEFMRVIGRLTGNHERHFGRLLTPLVEGVRVAGPFCPDWWHDAGNPPRLVLIDSEGLGHKIEATASVPTSISRQFSEVDVILLVDTARQPLQAAPSNAVKTIVAAGYESKLMICFTHFDLVEGDNLPDDQAKMNHVLYALTNLLDKVGQDVDPIAEEALERFLQGRVFFAGHLNQMKFPDEDSQTLVHLNNLVDAIVTIAEPDRSNVQLFYEEYKLPLGVRTAVNIFHQTWRALLGLESRPDIPKEHWARIKALTRHIGLLGKDQYAHLQPSAKLVELLIQQISRYLDRPDRLVPEDADDNLRQAAIARAKNKVHSGLLNLVGDALIHQQSLNWQTAYRFSGTGSTTKRSHAVREILETAAPLKEDFDSSDDENFLLVIRNLVRDAIKEVGGRLVRSPDLEEALSVSTH